MTRGELWKGVIIKALLVVTFVILGSLAVKYALEMVFIFGETLGVDERSREIYGRSHMIIHLFATSCALAVGVFVWLRYKGLSRLAAVALLLCGSYGILNMVGFTATNRVSVAAAKDAGNQASEREYLAARSDIEKQIKWLEGQVLIAESPREQRRFASQVDAKRKEMSAIKAPRPTAGNVLADPLASVLAAITFTDPKTWTLALPVMSAILLFVVESLSFVFAGHLLGGIVGAFGAYSVVAASLNQKTSGGSGGLPGSGGTEPRKLGLVRPPEPASPRAIKTSEPDNLRSVMSGVVSTDAPKGKLTYEQFADVISQDMAHGEPASSTRALARQTGWSQTSTVRQQHKVKGKSSKSIRRYAGNGGGMHHASARG